MRSVSVTELKANLSRYLRIAARGTRIVVKDRDDPIAVLGPLEADSVSWSERLARSGRLRLGSQDWSKLRISRVSPAVDIQAALRAVREDAT